MSGDVSEYVSQVLVAMAEAHDDIEAVMQMQPTLWLVSFSDERQVDVSLDQDGQRLTFFAEVGHLPKDGRTRCLEALLSYNMMSRETGGVRTALSGPAGEVSLIADLMVDGMQPVTIGEYVLGLRDIATGWRAFLENTPGGDNNIPFENMIRG